MSIESLDLNKAVSFLGIDDDEESWLQFDDYHRAALRRLEASGADFALGSAAFLLLFMWQTPPWLVVILSAAAGALISLR